MTVLEILTVLGDHLIEIMGITLVVALGLRYMAYRNGKSNQTYFRTMSMSVEKWLGDAEFKETSGKLDQWIRNLMTSVEKDLPTRGVRLQAMVVPDRPMREGSRSQVRDFISAKRNVVYAISQQADALQNPHPPNFMELSERVLNHDPYWKNLFGFIPIETLQRVLGILPGLFIVGGILGTFVGITAALPMIGKIDLSDLETATAILNGFVESISYSMKTSVAGIIYSVILTVLNTIYPLASVRYEIKAGMASTFETIWHQIHNDKMTYGEQEVVKLLQQLVYASNGKKAS